MRVQACAGCGANLSAPGSVAHTERYAAYVDSADESALVVDSFTVDGSAVCVRCGTAAEYGSLSWTGGVSTDAVHRADWDRRTPAGDLVPVWCACGWLSIAPDVAQAQSRALAHEDDPPRFEVRLFDARHLAADLRPQAWIAAGSSADVLLGFAERVACELWNDDAAGVCICDTFERKVVWADGAWTE